MVSRRYRDIADNNNLWKKKIKIHFSKAFNALPSHTEINWKAKFSECYKEEYNLLSTRTRQLYSAAKDGNEGELKRLGLRFSDLYISSDPDRFDIDATEYHTNLTDLCGWIFKHGKNNQALLDYLYGLVAKAYETNIQRKDAFNRTILHWDNLKKQ